jgi:membrane protease YdiL (CAAX protease family)
LHRRTRGRKPTSPLEAQRLIQERNDGGSEKKAHKYGPLFQEARKELLSMKNNPLEVAVRLLFVVALAIIFTWVFNHTRGSIFFSNLLHASIDTPQVVWVPLFLIVDMTSLDLAALIGFGVPALLIIILTRGRPGY